MARISQFERNRYGRGYNLFALFNICLLSALGLICLLPMLHVLALSFSDNNAISQGKVSFWPVGSTVIAYQYLFKNQAFWRSIGVSFQRVALGGVINMILIVLTAYPLSMPSDRFPKRRVFAWFFLFTMLFGGGLIPTYLTVTYTGITNSLWALVLPGALPIGNLILMLNFFRQLPESVSEAAFIDGAGHWKTLWQIIVPMSLPAIATILLFVVVSHWNEWFSAFIYMKRVEKYPLQTYLQSTIISAQFTVTEQGDMDVLQKLSNKTVRSAQIFIGMLPILMVYPFLQKYFTKGIVLGSVKG